MNILVLLLSLVLFAGCEKDVNDERLRVTPSNIEIGCEGGTVQVDIESTSGWEVIVESDCTWVKSDRYESEVGRRQWIKLTISKNNTENTRNTTITIRNSGQSRDITITQTPISLNVSPESIDAGQEKTTKDISINSNISWSAKSSDSWITLSKSSGTAGTTTLNVNIEANTLASSRSGYVEISNSEYNISRRINIQQDGYTPPEYCIEYCIEYTSTSQITIDSSAYFGALIESHTWNNGNGVIIFDGPVTSIGNKAFLDCTTLTSITIPESVTSIGKWAFTKCSGLTSITIPNSVTSIGYCAFYGCSSLTSITIPNSVTSIEDSAFWGCSSLISITIGNGVTSIGYCVFYGCSSLSSITIPESVTEIGRSAFSSCSSLNSITIPESVTSIGHSAFYGCRSLISITIPNSVTSIGYGAFSYCNSLTSVYCKATTPPALDIDVFAGNGSGRKIYVPRNSVNAYKSAEGWSDYAWHIVGYDF